MHENPPTAPLSRPHRRGGTFAAGCLLGFFLLAGCGAEERDLAAAVEPSPSDRTGLVDTTFVPEEGVVGQTVYVPVYSHIYDWDGSREFNLAATLSIRNTDPDHPITVTGVRYYDSGGRLVRRYLAEPRSLGPLSSEAFVVEEQNKAGGVGANFIVEWQAGVAVSAPIVEAVMVSTANTQGVSFVTRGQVVRSFGEASGPASARR